MIIKNLIEREKYREAAKISTLILWQLYEATKLGIYPIEVDDLAFKLCKKYNVRPSFFGVGELNNRYKNATCISVNDTVVHGIPSKTEIFKSGDIVKVDFGIIYENFCTDHCFSVGLGEIKDEKLRLLEVAKEAVWRGAKATKTGGRVGDVGFAMQNYALENGMDTIKNFTGHAIGHNLHDGMIIPAFGSRGEGKMFNEGLVACIEAQVVTKGKDRVFTDKDGWTVKTVAGNDAAMFEFMVIVGEEPEILTKETYGWSVTK